MRSCSPSRRSSTSTGTRPTSPTSSRCRSSTPTGDPSSARRASRCSTCASAARGRSAGRPGAGHADRRPARRQRAARAAAAGALRRGADGRRRSTWRVPRSTSSAPDRHARPSTRCGEALRRVLARHAVLGWGLPDRRGHGVEAGERAPAWPASSSTPNARLELAQSVSSSASSQRARSSSVGSGSSSQPNSLPSVGPLDGVGDARRQARRHDAEEVGAAAGLAQHDAQVHGPGRRVVGQRLGVDAGVERQAGRVDGVVDLLGGGAERVEPVDAGERARGRTRGRTTGTAGPRRGAPCAPWPRSTSW